MLLAFVTIAGLLGFGVWMLVGAASTRTAGGSAVLAVLGRFNSADQWAAILLNAAEQSDADVDLRARELLLDLSPTRNVLPEVGSQA